MLHELPGVGENMQDHWQVRCTYKVKNTITMNQWVANPLRRYAMGAYYLATRRGPMGMQPPQLCAFTRSDPSQDTPNLQYHVSPTAPTASAGRCTRGPVSPAASPSCGRKASATCASRAPDPHAHPAILHNFLRDAGSAARRGRRDSHDAQDRARPALAQFEPEEIAPGADCRSDDEILAYARQTVITVFHQSGTCKMGHDPLAVVDDRLRVRGLTACA